MLLRRCAARRCPSVRTQLPCLKGTSLSCPPRAEQRHSALKGGHGPIASPLVALALARSAASGTMSCRVLQRQPVTGPSPTEHLLVPVTARGAWPLAPAIRARGRQQEEQVGAGRQHIACGRGRRAARGVQRAKDKRSLERDAALSAVQRRRRLAGNQPWRLLASGSSSLGKAADVLRRSETLPVRSRGARLPDCPLRTATEGRASRRRPSNRVHMNGAGFSLDARCSATPELRPSPAVGAGRGRRRWRVRWPSATAPRRCPFPCGRRLPRRAGR
jgi:hypothetical protein